MAESSYQYAARRLAEAVLDILPAIARNIEGRDAQTDEEIDELRAAFEDFIAEQAALQAGKEE